MGRSALWQPGTLQKGTLKPSEFRSADNLFRSNEIADDRNRQAGQAETNIDQIGLFAFCCRLAIVLAFALGMEARNLALAVHQLGRMNPLAVLASLARLDVVHSNNDSKFRKNGHCNSFTSDAKR